MISTDKLSNQWNDILLHIRDEFEIRTILYDTWISPLRLGSVHDDIISIYVPKEKKQLISYYDKNYKAIMEAALSEVVNSLCHVVFTVEDETDNAVTEDIHERSSLNRTLEHANLNPRYRFDTFVVGSNNTFAHSACIAVAHEPGTVYNPLYLHGGAGLGKTHLMHSIGHYILEENPNKKVIYVTSESFTNEVIESIRSGNAGSMTKLRDKYRTVDVLMIDDIQFLIGKTATQEEFFHTFNELHAAGKQIVISSDKPPKEINSLDDRFRSRFEMGLLADIQPPDYETRMAILRRHAEEQTQYVNNEVLEYIATNIQSNIRELEGAFNKIIAYSKLNRLEITPELAHVALKDLITTDQRSEVTPNMIASVVCEQYNVQMSQITSRKKTADLVVPRQVIMYLCREYTDTTLDSVAQLLCKKDHSTIMHGVDKIRADLVTNKELRANIDIIMKKLNLQSN